MDNNDRIGAYTVQDIAIIHSLQREAELNTVQNPIIPIKYTDEEYFNLPQISNSDILLINHSIKKYLKKGGRKSTPAMVLGTAFHFLIMFPDRFKDTYEIVESTGTNKSKERIAAGELLIAEKDYDMIMAMADNIYCHPLSIFFNHNIEFEKVLLFDYLGVECKMKMDVIDYTDRIIYDFKSIEELEKAEYSMKNTYRTQSEFYKIGANANFAVPELNDFSFRFIFVEKQEPYEVAFMELVNPYFVELANADIIRGLNRYKSYLEGNSDINYSNNLILI